MPTDDNPLCQLCKKREANQTGSHLTSCFIVNSQLGPRDKEKGYLITPNPHQDYSKNLQADEIKEDYIFCSGCEKRLSFIENYFSREFTNKIDQENFSANFPTIELVDKNLSEFILCENINPIVFHLLIYSIIWRASISDKTIFEDFKLDPKVEEDLRFLLDLYLPEYKGSKIVPKEKVWLRDVSDVPDFFTFYPYLILRSEEEEINIDELSKEELEAWEKRKTKNALYFSADDDHPYHIMLNEFLILPFFKKGEVEFQTQDFFELNNKYELKGQMNKELGKVKIGILKSGDWERILRKIYTIASDNRIEEMQKYCIEVYLKNGIIPTKIQVEDCVSQIVSQTKIEK